MVALDGSERAPGVCLAAVEIATRFDAALYPFRAILIPPEFPPAAAGSHTDLLPGHLIDAAIEDMLRIVADAAPNAAVAPPTVRSGQPWRAILAASEELNADLIVMGSHGYHGLDRVLGTTAGKVVNLARRNVLVVHNRDAELLLVRKREPTRSASPSSPSLGSDPKRTP